MTDYSSTSISELRKILVDSGKYTEEEANNIKGKSKVVEAVLSLEDKDNSLQELLSNIDDSNEENKNSFIDYNSPEWHDYAMSQFKDIELDNGYPTLYGLRRVAELLLGDIIQSGPTTVFPPNTPDEPGRATVIYTVVFDWNNTGKERAFSAAGGAWEGNTDKTFNIFPEAIAEARAEGRALRKALKLRVVAAEEMVKEPVIREKEKNSTGEWDGNAPISDIQKTFIKLKCEQFKINLDKFLNHNGWTYSSLDEVNKDVAKNMIELFNKYQTNTKDSLPIPEEIKN